MTTKKQHSRTSIAGSRDQRDQELDRWAKNQKPSIRWSPSDRQRWRRVDRELAEDFAPRLKDEQDLRWYFQRGPNGDRDGTPEMLKRWRRVDRCLDGSGHALMLHYVGKDYPSSGKELRQLAADYRQYLRNSVKGYGAANWEPYCIATEQQLRALIDSVRPAHETVRRSSRRSEESFLAQRRRDEEPGLSLLIRDIPKSTWGARKLSLEQVRLLLEMACAVPYVDARAMDAVDAIELIKTKLATLQDSPPAVDERDEPKSAKKGRARILEDLEREKLEKREIKKLHASEFDSGPRGFVSQWTGTGGQALAPGTWDPRKVEVNNGRPITTVSEISGRLKLGTKWTRAALLSLQCPGLQAKSSAIPVAWFKSDKGLEFWKRAYSQQGRQVLDKDAAARLLRGVKRR